MSSIIFTDQQAPNGRTIRYNVDFSTTYVAAEVDRYLAEGKMMPIANESGGEPIFVNPERVATVAPAEEE